MKKKKVISVLDTQINILIEKHEELLSGKPTLAISNAYRLRLLSTMTDIHMFPDAEVNGMLLKNPDKFFELPYQYFINFNSVAEFLRTADKSYKYLVKNERKQEKNAKIENYQQRLINYAENQMREADKILTAKEQASYKAFEAEVEEYEKKAKEEIKKSVEQDKVNSSRNKTNPNGSGK